MDRLLQWTEISSQFQGGAVLIGNGFSINMCGGFEFGNLIESARLTETERKVVDSTNHGSGDFEGALRSLDESVVVGSILGHKVRELIKLKMSLRSKLIDAVRANHPNYSDLPDERLSAVRSELKTYSSVFTTNYDLLLYWASADDTFIGSDGFLMGSSGLSFDPERFKSLPTPRFHYMHGAIHLVHDAAGGGVAKIRASNVGLLTAIFDRWRDGNDIPVFVSEGSARKKLARINDSAYLSHCYHALSTAKSPLVIVGHALNLDVDRHIATAVSNTAKIGHPVAFGVYPPDRNPEHEGALRGMWGDAVTFFDSRTHPLTWGDMEDC